MVRKTIGDALKHGIVLLNENSIENAGLDARVIMCSVLSCNELYLTVHRDDEINEENEKKFFSFVKRRASNEPLGYILNHREFMSLDFYVDENVLIPRPDTEILAEKVISYFAGKKPVITDMCTGSGAIAVSLAKYIPGARVTGLDISAEAVKIAAMNAEKNGVSKNCSFLVYDVLKPYDVMADAVVSNPPYIPAKEIETLDETVKGYEPRIALDGGDDGLLFYRSIIKNSHTALKNGGLIAFEVGCNQAGDVARLMEEDFCDIGIIRDLAGIERVVYGIKKQKLTVWGRGNF